MCVPDQTEQDWKPFQSYAAGLGYKLNNAQLCSDMFSYAQIYTFGVEASEAKAVPRAATD